jgi:hypothetical protein
MAFTNMTNHLTNMSDSVTTTEILNNNRHVDWYSACMINFSMILKDQWNEQLWCLINSDPKDMCFLWRREIIKQASALGTTCMCYHRYSACTTEFSLILNMSITHWLQGQKSQFLSYKYVSIGSYNLPQRITFEAVLSLLFIPSLQLNVVQPIPQMLRL